jgi:hypothetical protein
MNMINTNEKVDNSNRKFGSANYYYHVKIKRGDIVVDGLLTETEVNNAEERAKKNPEDLPKSRFETFLVWLTSFFGGTRRQ